MTLLMVTHDPALAERAGRILEMQDGRLISDP
jgi:putative ABC transport system ATP-binding protein